MCNLANCNAGLARYLHAAGFPNGHVPNGKCSKEYTDDCGMEAYFEKPISHSKLIPIVCMLKRLDLMNLNILYKVKRRRSEKLLE